MQNNHQRKSIRLPGYDYQSAGQYFVTICVRYSIPLSIVKSGKNPELGTPDSNTPADPVSVELSDVGQMISDIISTIPEHSTGVSIDEYIIMPDHIHLLMTFSELGELKQSPRIDGNRFSEISPQSRTLGVVIRQFKSAVTSLLNKKAISGFLWQRNYYEHIVRNQSEFERIRWYIKQNPTKLLEAQIKALQRKTKP